MHYLCPMLNCGASARLRALACLPTTRLSSAFCSWRRFASGSPTPLSQGRGVAQTKPKVTQRAVNQEFMLGIIPAAGAGNRIQPLGFSKELLPVGSRLDKGAEKPKAVSEYLVERLICAGADKLCFVISPAKTDILEYYASGAWGAQTIFAVQEHPDGLCDAVFRPAPFVSAGETVVIGLPDTVWFPKEALCALPGTGLSLLLFP